MPTPDGVPGVAVRGARTGTDRHAHRDAVVGGAPAPAVRTDPPSDPARLRSSRAPAAWAASSTIGRPKRRSASTGATFPNRCTGMIARVRDVIFDSTVSGVTQ